jgi:hypothetical protein
MWHRRNALAVLLLSSAVAALTGCGKRKTIGRDNARSEIRSALSLAAESHMFIDYIRSGRATHHYAAAQTAYLKNAVGRSLKEIGDGTPEPGIEEAVRECRTLLERLAQELAAIQRSIDNDDALAGAGERIGIIHKELENARAKL